MTDKSNHDPHSSFLAEPKGNPARIAELLCELQELWFHEQERVQTEYSRSLPFGDYIVDRWQKAQALRFGAGTSIYDSSLVLGDVSVGSNTWIGPYTILDGSGGGLVIGNYCSISAGVQIYSHDSVQWATSGGKMPIEHAKTRIGSNCYIGPNVVISKGICIGDGCIIGANSVVLQDLPAGTKAFGNPCKPA